MDLLEEYYKRHKIDSPLIRFPNHSYLLGKQQLCERGESRYILIGITYVKKADSPPSLRVNCTTPVRDSNPGAGGSFSRTVWDKKVEFDEWEGFVTEWVANLKTNFTLVPQEQLPLAIWEIFIYNNDSWLAQSLPANLYESLAQIVDDSLDVKDRLEATKVVESWLGSRNGKQGHNSLSTLRTNYDAEGYANWLASMLK